MSVLLIIPNRNLDKLVHKFNEMLPDTVIEVWPDVSDPESVEYIVAWQLPENSLAPFINCKAIASFGAGVDSILNYKNLPDVPVTRIIDTALAHDMSRYVLSHILAYQHHIAVYGKQQLEHIWRPKRALKNNVVTVLGAGQLGLVTAKLMLLNGFEVNLWSNSKKSVDGINSFTHTQLLSSINNADFVVNLLPLTPDTKGVLNHNFFTAMKKGTVFINVARGDIVDDDSLLQALATQRVAHAILDVFAVEPLPLDHHFWQHENITITPHCSALSDINTVTAQLVDNYLRLKNELPLLNTVDRYRGY